MPDTVTQLRPGVGHNNPPEAIDVNDPEILRARLGRDYKAMLERFAEIEIGAKQVPAKIATEAQAQKLVTWVAEQVRPLTSENGEARTAHKKEKQPFLACGRVVDEFFLRRIDQLNNAVGVISRRAEQFLVEKKAEQRRREEAERRRAEAERQRAADEAARLQAEADARAAAGDRPAASQAQVRADEAAKRADTFERIANNPPAAVNIAGEYGSTMFIKESWDYAIEDPSLVPPGYWIISDEVVRAALKDGVREIPGIRIFPVERGIIRKC